MQKRSLTPKWVQQKPVAVGIVASALAACSYGFAQFLARQVFTTYEIPSLTAATFGLLTGLVILAALSSGNIKQDIHAPKKAFLFIALSGLAASSGVGFNYTALSLAPVVVVAPVSSITPLISLVLAHLFLQRLERITLRIWLGAALVVAGVVLVVLGTA